MPKPVAQLSDAVIESLNKRIEKGRNPTYTVKSISARQKPGGNGTFDVVDYTWKGFT